MIRQIQYFAPGIEMREIADRALLNPSDVKVRIAYSGVCGSDIHLWRGDLDEDPRVKAGARNGLCVGHEASGYVEELGPAATQKGLKVGDRVALYFNRYCGNCYYCRSGKEQFCTNIRMIDNFMSDFVVVNEQMVYKIDDALSMRQAALVEPISVCLHGIDLCNIQQGSTVAVCGGGGIGNLMTQLAKLAGAERVALFEPVAEKRELALNCGADFALNPLDADFSANVRELSFGLGFDTAIECSGTDAGIKSCFDAVGRGGTVELMATYKKGATLKMIGLEEAFLKELKLIAGVYQSPYTIIRAIRLARQMDSSFVRIFKPEQAAQAFELQAAGGVVKSMFCFHEQ